VDKTSKRFECFEYRLQDTQVVLEKGDRLNALINYSGDGQLFFILAVAEEHHMLVADNFVQQWKASRDETRGCKVERGKTTESRLSANDGFVSLEEALRAAEEEKLPLTPSQQRMMKDHQHRDRSSKKQGTLASAA
jgi:predicted amidohydrolase